MMMQATAACPIQISVVLDSGVFLTYVDQESYSDCQIGYFAPEFMIYGDWHLLPSPDLRQPIAPSAPMQSIAAAVPMQSIAPADPTRSIASLESTWARIGSREIAFRHIDADGNEKTDGVILSQSLRDHLLRREKIYEGEDYSPPLIEARFDWIFRFYSGFFRCSSVKDRFFKQCNGFTHQPNTIRKKFEKIAHDVVVHFELAPYERFEIVVGDKVLWNSADHKVTKRFDIEVIGPHATAENYFRDALDHRGNDYWLPNQGDPGPMGGRP
jgi:hypothetical protein